MHDVTRRILYIILVILMVSTFYMVFNAGNPNSLLRIFIEDTSYDITITVLLSIGVAVIVMLLTRKKSDRPLKYTLELNKEHIQKLRSQGKSDYYIARDFLKHIGIKNKIVYWLTFRKVVRYLKKME
jgi:hypothetical protein